MDNQSALGALTRSRRTAGRRGPAILLSIALLLGFLLLLAYVFRGVLRPSLPVETAAVLLLPGHGAEPAADRAAGSDTLLFQASGWVEADPWPTRVAVLEDGFVETVLVKEGETVSAGDLLARLDATDAGLRRDERALAVQQHRARLNAHTNRLQGLEARVARLTAAETAQVARAATELDRWERIQTLEPEDTSAAEQVAARAAADTARAETLAARLATQEARRELEQHGVRHAQFAVELSQAEKALEIAALSLSRMELRAPISGVVLRRYVVPGSKRMAGMDDPDSATIVTIYDPASLQVRVDVPLAEAGRLREGQRAEISSALLGEGRLSGRVTRVVGEADLQRNTLQAKVAIEDPDARLRPEVLCRVAFFGAGDGSAATGTRSGAALWVPTAALSASGRVWVLDPTTGRVTQQQVELGQGQREGYRQVLNGLRANERVVVSGAERLKDGVHVKEAGRG